MAVSPFTTSVKAVFSDDIGSKFLEWIEGVDFVVGCIDVPSLKIIEEINNKLFAKIVLGRREDISLDVADLIRAAPRSLDIDRHEHEWDRDAEGLYTFGPLPGERYRTLREKASSFIIAGYLRGEEGGGLSPCDPQNYFDAIDRQETFSFVPEAVWHGPILDPGPSGRSNSVILCDDGAPDGSPTNAFYRMWQTLLDSSEAI
jgi:hypothetical protein